MRNPPNFVLYVFMIKHVGHKKFMPHIGLVCRLKKEAEKYLPSLREQHGRGNVYIQQYGPYS